MIEKNQFKKSVIKKKSLALFLFLLIIILLSAFGVFGIVPSTDDIECMYQINILSCLNKDEVHIEAFFNDNGDIDKVLADQTIVAESKYLSDGSRVEKIVDGVLQESTKVIVFQERAYLEVFRNGNFEDTQYFLIAETVVFPESDVLNENSLQKIRWTTNSYPLIENVSIMLISTSETKTPLFDFDNDGTIEHLDDLFLLHKYSLLDKNITKVFESAPELTVEEKEKISLNIKNAVEVHASYLDITKDGAVDNYDASIIFQYQKNLFFNDPMPYIIENLLDNSIKNERPDLVGREAELVLNAKEALSKNVSNEVEIIAQDITNNGEFDWNTGGLDVGIYYVELSANINGEKAVLGKGSQFVIGKVLEVLNPSRKENLSLGSDEDIEWINHVSPEPLDIYVNQIFSEEKGEITGRGIYTLEAYSDAAYARDLFVIDDYAYFVANALMPVKGDLPHNGMRIKDGLFIVDISNPDNPVLVGKAQDSEYNLFALADPTAVFVEEINGRRFAFVTSEADNGVQPIDVTDPNNPIIHQYANILDETMPVRKCFDGHCFDVPDDSGENRALLAPRSIFVSKIGEKYYAFVASYTDKGVEVLDVSEPFSIKHVTAVFDDSEKLLDGPSEIIVSRIGGNVYAFVSSRIDDGIEILDVSNPANPVHAGSISNMNSVALQNIGDIEIADVDDSKYLFASGNGANGEGEIIMFEISDPHTPTYVGKLSEPRTSWGSLKVEKELMYVQKNVNTPNTDPNSMAAFSSKSYLQIFNISDPYEPLPIKSVSSEDMNFNPGIVTVSDGNAFFIGSTIKSMYSSNAAFKIFNIETITRSPFKIASVNQAENNYAWNVGTIEDTSLGIISPGKKYTISVKSRTNPLISGESEIFEISEDEQNLNGFSIVLKPGWNLVAFPVKNPISLDELSLECDYVGDVYAFGSNDWSSSPEYYEAEDLQAGMGYWLLSDSNEECTYTIPENNLIYSSLGNLSQDSDLPNPESLEGWNLIGGYDGEVRDILDVDLVEVWDSDKQKYIEISEVSPNQGFWINNGGETSLIEIERITFMAESIADKLLSFIRTKQYISGNLQSSIISNSHIPNTKSIRTYLYVKTDFWYMHPYEITDSVFGHESYAKMNDDGTWDILTILRNPNPDYVMGIAVDKDCDMPKNKEELSEIIDYVNDNCKGGVIGQSEIIPYAESDE